MKSKAKKAAAEGRAARRVATTFDVKALRSRLGVSRNVLARLLDVSAGSVFNWERGTAITPKNIERLEALSTKAAKGEVTLPERRKGVRPKKKATATTKATTTKASKPAKSPAGTFNVKALRTQLGLSRNSLAKMLNVSVGSVANWETPGKTIYPKNLAKLEDLAASASNGTVSIPEKKRSGRPSIKAVVTPKPGRPSSVAISGSMAPTYANVIVVTRGDREALVRFALALPGGSGATVIAEMLVPIEAIDGLR